MNLEKQNEPMHCKIAIVILSILSALACANNAKAETPGVEFTKASSWQEVLAKAKAEHKFIFVDCFATWCRPCKYMNDKIYPLPEVGMFFNAKFISVKLQTDQTKNDSNLVRLWYSDAKNIVNEYGIASIPTYLFFSPEGVPLHRFTGASKTSGEFLARVKDALDPRKQFYAVVGKLNEHKSDSAYLSQALEMEIDEHDVMYIGPIATDLMGTPEGYSRNALKMYGDAIGQGLLTPSNAEAVIRYFAGNVVAIDKMVRTGFAENAIRSSAYITEEKPLLDSNVKVADWASVGERIERDYPGLKAEMTAKIRMDYYQKRKMWTEWEQSVHEYMSRYAASLGTDYFLNEMAWQVFLHATNKDLIREALDWSHKTVLAYPKIDGEFADTYARLLYKMGDRDHAILWEAKAIEISLGDNKVMNSDRQEFEKGIAKMEKREARLSDDERI